jgi:hypothetical protein
VIEHTFRQSQLNTWLMCPEQYRLDAAGLLPRQETEATAVGTAVHAAIETVLRGDATIDEGHDAAMDAWDKIKPTIDKWVKASPETCVAHVSNCYNSWADTCYPQLPAIEAVEKQFNVLLYEDDDRRIYLSGTVDAVDETGCVWDWKTAGRAYEPWEADRFKIQPTVYTYAARHAWGIDNPEFAYAVMVKRATPVDAQILVVQRDERHWSWLQKQALSLALTIEADLPVWQLNDQGWWCSDRWCGAWASCKGAHVDA